ncbi:MAG: nitroreductase [Burkholderiales bacterium]|nr:nitroreductase [Burkholderiales bacterium]
MPASAARAISSTGDAPAAPLTGDHLPPALASLLGRTSLGVRHLSGPAPSEGELTLMARAALRAPDHAGLVPWRLKLVRGDARQHMATLFEQAALAAGKSADDARNDFERALAAPVSIAVVARIDLGHPLVPAHEQWAAVGGAITNFLNAAHALGYAGKMLSGGKVRRPELIAAFCDPGETLVGWLALGRPTKAGKVSEGKPAADQVMIDWPKARHFPLTPARAPDSDA